MSRSIYIYKIGNLDRIRVNIFLHGTDQKKCDRFTEVQRDQRQKAFMHLVPGRKLKNKEKNKFLIFNEKFVRNTFSI